MIYLLLKQIQYFLAVAECKHFTRAADQLFVSQSALSQQITKLENDLGMKLINRVKHPIQLTPAGQDFMLYAKKITHEVEQMHQNLQKHLSIEKRTIHLGVITGLGNINIASIFTAFNSEHPNIKFAVTNELSKELCKLLCEGNIDLALFAAPHDIDSYNFEVHPLEKEEFVLITPANHPFSQKETIKLSETANENFIFPTKKNVSYDIFFTECRKAGFTPKIVSECNGPGRRIDLVQAGLGIAFISLSGLQYYNNSASLSIVRLVDPFYKHIVLARTKQEKSSMSLLMFWQYIQQWK
ncbi:MULTISPECIES: LysR family transcriptional regulator [Pelosinus]|uniref:LysR substrate-binding protein n=1 Tax=Pelosinus fermentans B4 TaxID=1149862 RepID=I8RL10_9FIRM|nr:MULTISPECIES: LysR family transcriptional regulator [Pelosinus]EIW21008.1 LysR substrate-binding protein [Pelosinus fermentans B4]EIW27124.1 transcriptional regulator, LysR family [Pelosinus fermentans A11]